MKAPAIFALALSLLSSCAMAESAPTMKAGVVHQYGGPEVVKYEDTPRPEAKGRQVLVRVMAAGVNPVDGAIRAGRWPIQKPPFIPGYDVAGIVEMNPGGTGGFKRG